MFNRRNNRFRESYNVKYFKEIKHLKSPQKAEASLEPKQASTMELFCEYTLNITVKAYYFRNKSSTIDVLLGYIWPPKIYLNFQS